DRLLPIIYGDDDGPVHIDKAARPRMPAREPEQRVLAARGRLSQRPGICDHALKVQKSKKLPVRYRQPAEFCRPTTSRPTTLRKQGRQTRRENVAIHGKNPHSTPRKCP